MSFTYFAKFVVEQLHSYNINISAKTLYGYESGLSMPNADAFVSLCRIYKCDNPMEMLSGSVNNVLFSGAELELLEKYRSLAPIGQEHISTILNWESARTTQIKNLEEMTTPAPKRVFAYYGKIAAAGTSYGFDDVIAGTKRISADRIKSVRRLHDRSKREQYGADLSRWRYCVCKENNTLEYRRHWDLPER